MFETLIQQIKTTLESVDMVKEVFARPNPKITKIPAVVFFPQDFSNAYETNRENAKEYRFKMFVVVNLQNVTEEEAFETILPKTVDQIMAKFDTEWDYGVNTGGQRIRTLLGAGFWGVMEDKTGKEAYAELNLTIKTLTTN